MAADALAGCRMTSSTPPDEGLFPEGELAQEGDLPIWLDEPPIGLDEPPTGPDPEPAPVPAPVPEPVPERRVADRPDPDDRATATSSAVERLVVGRPWLERGHRAWIPLEPGDRPAAAVGDTVTPLTVVAEHARDTRLVSVDPRDRDPARFPPGSRIGPRDARPRRRRGSLVDEGTVLYRSSRTRLNVAVGRHREPLHARADGTVMAVTPGGISLLLAGQALAGVAAAGRAVHGRLRIAVGDPGDELRSAGLHVADAGSIVVAGARVDVETLTRARALGIHGVVVGGMAGHDLRAFTRSQARQREALHSLAPFAVFVLEGFGRRSLAGPPWELLLAAAGTSVSIFPDPPLLVFDPAATLPQVARGTLRITAGAGAGTAGSIDGPAVIQRLEEGVHVLAVAFVGGGRRWLVPLADLERFQ